MATSDDLCAASLKRNLENWREVVVLADRLLCWEQDWLAGVMAG
jgi:hypothetical protein